MECGVAVDVAFDDAWRDQTAGHPVAEQGLEDATRLVAQVTAFPGVQDEVGEGIGHVADCRRVPGIGPRRRLDLHSMLMTEQTTLFEQVGGQPFFDTLVDRFYDGVEADTLLLPLYPDRDDLVGARRRLALFLGQYWGGPTTYSDERGHPRLRARHFPFSIGAAERDRWLVHMREAIDATDAPADAKARLHQ
jgi:hemoglobin